MGKRGQQAQVRRLQKQLSEEKNRARKLFLAEKARTEFEEQERQDEEKKRQQEEREKHVDQPIKWEVRVPQMRQMSIGRPDGASSSSEAPKQYVQGLCIAPINTKDLVEDRIDWRDFVIPVFLPCDETLVDAIRNLLYQVDRETDGFPEDESVHVDWIHPHWLQVSKNKNNRSLQADLIQLSSKWTDNLRIMKLRSPASLGTLTNFFWLQSEEKNDLGGPMIWISIDDEMNCKDLHIEDFECLWTLYQKYHEYWKKTFRLVESRRFTLSESGNPKKKKDIQLEPQQQKRLEQLQSQYPEED